MDSNAPENGEIHWSETWKMRATAMGTLYSGFLMRQMAIWAIAGATFGGAILFLTWLFHRRQVTMMPDLLFPLIVALYFGGLRFLMDLIVPREIYVSRSAIRWFYGRLSYKSYSLQPEAAAKVERLGVSVLRVEFRIGETGASSIVVGAAPRAGRLEMDLHRVMGRRMKPGG